jgi:hypothetical protein
VLRAFGAGGGPPPGRKNGAARRHHSAGQPRSLNDHTAPAHQHGGRHEPSPSV